jgi:hypothetical protein
VTTYTSSIRVNRRSAAVRSASFSGPWHWRKSRLIPIPVLHFGEHELTFCVSWPRRHSPTSRCTENPWCDSGLFAMTLTPYRGFQLNSRQFLLRCASTPCNPSRHRVQPVGVKSLKWLHDHYENHTKCRIIVHKFKGCRYEIHRSALGWMTSLLPMVSPARGPVGCSFHY